MGDFLSRTMLIERLLGVSLYCLVLVFFYYKIYCAKKYKEIKYLLFAYIIVLMIMAFFVIPESSADLYRWRNMSEPWKQYSLSEFYERELKNVSSPIAYLYVYIFQNTSINGLLPAFCALVFYSCIFYMVYKSSIVFKISSKSTANVLLIVMSLGKFFETISGVRSMVSIAIVAVLIFREFILNKKMIWDIPLYLIASLIHPLALALFISRLGMIILEKNSSVFRKVINLSLLGVLIFLGLKYGIKYLNMMTDKAESYLSGNKYSYFWEYLMAIIMYIAIVYYLIKQKNNILPNSRLSNMYKYVCILVVLEFVICFQYSMFHRLVTFTSIIMIPIWAATFKVEKGNLSKLSQRRWIYLSILLLLLACTRGDLCAYKFVRF